MAAHKLISQTVATLESTWAVIARRHPPLLTPVAFSIASGTVARRSGYMTKGHFAAARWTHAENHDTHEVFIAGELLRLGAQDVLATLLHEAAHALAHARGVRDTSRQGRYHNARYKRLAEEVGLAVAKIRAIGWSGTSLTEATQVRYAAQLERLSASLVAHRRAERSGLGASRGRMNSNNGVPAICECGRRIRVAPSVLRSGGIECCLCGSRFLRRSVQPS